MTQPPIVPGPYDPQQGWEPMAPPLPPPAPPQVAYIQRPGAISREVSNGIIGAQMQWLYVTVAVVFGIPLTCCAGWLIVAGLGKLFNVK